MGDCRVFNARDAGETVNKTLSYDGQIRTYTVYVPDSYTNDEPWPLVMNFHGTNEDSDEIAEISQMNPVADTEEFLVAYPKSASNRWNAQQLETRAIDLGFVVALLEQLRTIVGIQEIKATKRHNHTGTDRKSTSPMCCFRNRCCRFATDVAVSQPMLPFRNRLPGAVD